MVWRTYEAGEYSRSENLQRNEKIKAISSIATNGGLGLFAAAVARWFYEQVDGHTILWLCLGAAAMWAGVHILTLMEDS